MGFTQIYGQLCKQEPEGKTGYGSTFPVVHLRIEVVEDIGAGKLAKRFCLGIQQLKLAQLGKQREAREPQLQGVGRMLCWLTRSPVTLTVNGQKTARKIHGSAIATGVD